MRITLLTVGRCRTAYLEEGAADYARRIGRYATLEQVVVKEERGQKGRLSEDITRKEGTRLLDAVHGNAFLVALDRSGQACTSDDLAARISELGLAGRSRMAFVIGGAFGLAQEVLKRADWRLSISSMTYTHEMTRLVILEQIYRAFTILRGEPYHK